ncbi:MAG: hypothetical protein AAGH57_12360 [Pseudomonadota bacterium]
MFRTANVLAFGVLGVLTLAAAPAPAAAETFEEYTARLHDICAVECMYPRDMIRKARRRDKDDESDMAVMVDIYDVSRWNDLYMLHTRPRSLLYPGQRTPNSLRPELFPNGVAIELDEATFFDLLDVPVPGSAASKNGYVDQEGNIIVERDRDMFFSRPTLRKLRSMFRNRRILARGQPRLVAGFTNGRRDFARKRVFLRVDNADDLAVLPRFDKDGEPIFDGPLASVAPESAKAP